MGKFINKYHVVGLLITGLFMFSSGYVFSRSVNVFDKLFCVFIFMVGLFFFIVTIDMYRTWLYEKEHKRC
jgi:membrane protein DedA with SNARE-associated domain